jgi:hypothetical protein
MKIALAASLASIALLAACGPAAPSTIKAGGTVLGTPSDAAFTALEATRSAAPGLCDVQAGTKVIITDAQGKEVGWALLKSSKLTSQFIDMLTFSVSVPGGSDHYGVQIAGMGNTLSETPKQLNHVFISCS